MKTFILLLLSLTWAHAQQIDLSSPRATMKTFLKSMKAYKEGEKSAITIATETLDLSDLDPATKNVSGMLAAERLINTLDRLEFIQYENIPVNPPRKKWFFHQRVITLPNGDKQKVEISLTENQEQEWKFSRQTIAHIADFYHAIQGEKVVSGVTELTNWRTRLKSQLPAWTGQRTFILLNGQWLGLLIVIFLGFILNKLIQFIVTKYINSFFLKKGITLIQERQDIFTSPLGIIVLSATWITGIQLLEFNDEIFSVLLRAGRVIITIGIVWAAHHFVDLVSFYFETLARRSANKFDDILVPLMRKSAKVFVFCIGFVMVGHSLTFNVTNILAGLGIGGLAFALAAKDTLSNLFGSLTVILDRPFQIGDWVNIGGSIEGIVEEVGFRSTRIRTFYDSLISVPNSQLTSTHTDNFGKRTYRRLSTTIGVQYDTPSEKVEAFCEGIRQIILGHPYTRKDNFHVYFNAFGSSSLDILLYVFWKVPDWSQELAEKHRLFLDILRLAHKIGVDFAFPTQTVHLFQEDKKTNEYQAEGSFHDWGKHQAKQILNEPQTMHRARSGIKLGEDFPPDQLGFNN